MALQQHKCIIRAFPAAWGIKLRVAFLAKQKGTKEKTISIFENTFL